MGKGRRLTISRSEQFLGRPLHSDDRQVDGETAVDLELMEEDVWSVIEPDQPTEEIAWTARSSIETSGVERRHGGRVSESDRTVSCDGRRKRYVATSAPVKVPDWSKILKVESMHSNNYADVADSDWESGMVPPHEYVARSRNGNGGSSVFLGVGRTLKGRDLRRVRDAVWSQTGFYG
ncbi:Protein S40-5 [Cardamine amara subsp. amara]|uniref:Protein S40-5 n=1 Tax=Cardamine amara subsp. amara TaxID=228776 RepID=A0ABD1AJV3_CARAN